jgi:hypothetical protein
VRPEYFEILFDRKKDIRITVEVCEAAAATEELSLKVLKLLHSRDPNISRTEPVLTAADENTESGKDTVEFILCH